VLVVAKNGCIVCRARINSVERRSAPGNKSESVGALHALSRLARVCGASQSSKGEIVLFVELHNALFIDLIDLLVLF